MRPFSVLWVVLLISGCREAVVPHVPKYPKIEAVFSSDDQVYLLASDAAENLTILPKEWNGESLVDRPDLKAMPIPVKSEFGKRGLVRCNALGPSIVCVAHYQAGPSNREGPVWLWHWHNGEEWKSGRITTPAPATCSAVYPRGGDSFRAIFEVFPQQGSNSRHGALVYINDCMNVSSDALDTGWFLPARDILLSGADPGTPLAPEANRTQSRLEPGTVPSLPGEAPR